MLDSNLPELSDLFAEADRIGAPYQTDEERAAFEALLQAELAEIEALIAA